MIESLQIEIHDKKIPVSIDIYQSPYRYRQANGNLNSLVAYLKFEALPDLLLISRLVFWFYHSLPGRLFHLRI